MTRREEGSESAMAQPSNVVTSQGAQLQWPRTGAREHPGLATLTQSICPLRHNSEGKSILAPCCAVAREGFANKPSLGQAHPSLSRTSLMAREVQVKAAQGEYTLRIQEGLNQHGFRSTANAQQLTENCGREPWGPPFLVH